MPHQACTVCAHEQRPAIDEALGRGQPSLRELAKQVGVTHSALWRHRQHGVPGKPKVVTDIKAEITKLRAAQTAAKRRRDTNAVLAISREIRNWMTLESKNQAASRSDSGNSEELPRSEALAMAKTIIEADLADGGLETKVWLVGLMARLNESNGQETRLSEVTSSADET